MRKLMAWGIVVVATASCGSPVGSSQVAQQAPTPQIESVPATPAIAARPLTLREKVNLGFQKHDAGEYDTAAGIFLDAATQAPAARSLAARSMMEAGRLADAYQQAVQAVREADCFPVTHFMLGLVAERNGHHDEAVEEYLRTLDRAPNDAGAHNNLGGLYYHREDFTRGRFETEEALRLATDNLGKSIALSNLAEFDEIDGKLVQAEERLDSALSISPDDAPAYFGLAELYDVTGRPDAAIKMAQTGLDIDRLGVTRRSESFVWPELQLHHDALLAEARFDRAAANEKWSAILSIEQKGDLKFAPLKGVAESHLKALSTPTDAPAAQVVPIATR